MQELPPDYVAELYRQSAFVSAVLGGFAVAFLGTLLGTPPERKSGTWATGFAVAAAVFFVVATFASTVIVLDVARLGITDFDYSNWPAATVRSKGVSDTTYFLGIYSLLLAVGVSGWTRSRRTGIISSVLAALGVVLLSVVVAGII